MVIIKTTKEPIIPTEQPSKPQEEVSINLFGERPDEKHVLVTQDIFTCSVASKIINSASAEPIIKALKVVSATFLLLGLN